MMKPNLSYDTIVIGGGQAGLTTGYFLQQHGRDFTILDAGERIGDSWRKRWDSLRLFTPARYNGLAGMPFPAPDHYFPTKDEMGDFLEGYAAHFKLPVRTGIRVDSLTRQAEGFLVAAGNQRFEAKQVVVAMANYQSPRVPAFASELDAGIVQFHSSAYQNLSQLQEGGVLIVGAGNSGSEIAMEASRNHPTWMSGRNTGQIPFRIQTPAAHRVFIPLVLRVLFHRVLTVNTPVGRKMRPKILTQGGPLIRIKSSDMAAAEIQRVPRTVGVRDGRPLLEDSHVLDVANVIWCTGFHPDFSWIKLPIFGEHEPMHERGIVASEPGLYFVGLHFQYALSSTMIHGIERDAEHVVNQIAARSAALAQPNTGRQIPSHEPRHA